MVEVGERAHALYSASGAHRWMNCAGSMRLEAGIEDTTSTFAEEGTAAHALAETCLIKNLDADQMIGEEFNGFTVDEIMAGFVQEYLDFVKPLGGDLYIEQRVDFSNWAPDGFGTADAVVLKDDEAHIIDLKYGEHVWASSKNNEQLMLYALGALHEHLMLYELKTFHLTIIQPRHARYQGPSTFTISQTDLLKWGEVVLDAVERTQLANPPLVPDEDKQCRFCKAKHVCPARNEAKLIAINEGFESFENPGKRRKITALTNDELAAIIPHLKGLEGWVSGLKKHITNTLEKGENIPGYKLVRSHPRRAWGDEEAAGKALSRKLTKAVAYETKLISVAKAEEHLGKKHLLIEKYSHKPEGGLTYAPDSDKREAIIVEDIADGFDILDEAA